MLLRHHGFRDHSRIKSLASVTGRVGYGWDRFLGYVKGGGAWERDDYTITILPASRPASATRSGWTVGIGGEYAFTNWLSGFVEYNYYDFGKRSLTFLSPGGGVFDAHRRQGNQERGQGWPQPSVGRWHGAGGRTVLIARRVHSPNPYRAVPLEPAASWRPPPLDTLELSFAEGTWSRS